jgi:hypothetical protein
MPKVTKVSFVLVGLAACTWLIAATQVALWDVQPGFAHSSGLPSPSPTYDPLQVPVLPENASESEFGKYLYYFHCMPCHGDLGQGLTDDFRQVWVEDHQNCWGRGCHGGRPQDEGFPIPTVVPVVISEADALPRFGDFASLQNYLHDTHPPQYPGKLADHEYLALTAYLWESNQKLAVEDAKAAMVAITAVPLHPTWTLKSTSSPDPTGTPELAPTAAERLTQAAAASLEANSPDEQPLDEAALTSEGTSTGRGGIPEGLLLLTGGGVILLALILVGWSKRRRAGQAN